MGIGIPYLGLAFADLSGEWLHTPARGPGGFPLGWLYIQHGVQVVFALLAIWILKKWFVPADYGLEVPFRALLVAAGAGTANLCGCTGSMCGSRSCRRSKAFNVSP
jgi:hypothetical protein